MRIPSSLAFITLAALVGCAQDKAPAHPLTAEEVTDAARKAVSDHGFSTDAVNQTRFYLQQDGKGWKVAAVFPKTPDSNYSHAIIHINQRGKVTDYSAH